MRLILVRHGETEGNFAQVSQSPDERLTATGLLQAKKLAKRLKSEHFDVVYVSDFHRAVKTAEEILKFHPSVPVVYSSQLRERDMGKLIGASYESVISIRDRSGVPYAHFKPEGGESFLEVMSRARKFLEKLVKLHPKETVLVVGHGTWISSFLLHLLKRPFERVEVKKIHPPNTAVSVFEVDEKNGFRLKLLNCTKHLSK